MRHHEWSTTLRYKRPRAMTKAIGVYLRLRQLCRGVSVTFYKGWLGRFRVGAFVLRSALMWRLQGRSLISLSATSPNRRLRASS